MTDNTQLAEYYSKAVVEALRYHAIPAILTDAKKGLTGDQHLFITFQTTLPGVVLTKSLLTKYPKEMSIILQHQFSELTVFPDRFSVVLSFDGKPTKLVIPFSAIVQFVDPSIKWGLAFEAQKVEKEVVQEEVQEPPKTAQDNILSFSSFRKK